MRGIQVLYIIAPTNFRDEEYFIPKQMIEEMGFTVITASKGVNIATGTLGKQATIDIDIKDVDPDDFDAIIIAGGSGALTYNNDPTINQILQTADENKTLMAAICLAPVILASAGVLEDRAATCWNEDNQQKSKLELGGAEFISNENVVIDHNIITANGPEASKEFAEQIINNI